MVPERPRAEHGPWRRCVAKLLVKDYTYSFGEAYKIMKRIILFFLFLALIGCLQNDNYVGTYRCKHRYGEETITLYSDYTFLQIYVDGNGLDSNKGKWRVESDEFYKPNILVLDGWMRFKAPIQSENAKLWFGEGEKSVSYFDVSSECIVVEPDFPEFNPCKNKR